MCVECTREHNRAASSTISPQQAEKFARWLVDTEDVYALVPEVDISDLLAQIAQDGSLSPLPYVGNVDPAEYRRSRRPTRRYTSEARLYAALGIDY
jgi:hypothetical protein